MKTGTKKSVKDGKMTNEQLGGFHRRVGEIERRINEGTLSCGHVMRELQLVIESQSSDLKITTAPLDPVILIGKGWKFVPEEQDERSNALAEVDFTKVEFVSCLHEGETSMKGEKKLNCLKQGSSIRLGATVFMGLWSDYQDRKEESILERLYQEKGVTYMDFFGDVLLAPPDGHRSVFYLYRNADGQWDWFLYWLDGDWLARHVSAVSSQVDS